MVSRLAHYPNIVVRWNTVVAGFLANDDGRLSSVQLQRADADGKGQGATWDLDVDGAFVAIGHIPNTQLFDGLQQDAGGYVHTTPGGTTTSVPGVYAAGDVQDSIYRQAITAAGSGAMAAVDVGRWLCEKGGC